MNSPNEFSRINFLFVTLFYCLDNISQSELGILNFELFSATPAILNCTILSLYNFVIGNILESSGKWSDNNSLLL